jgi:hypothetical protein
MSTFSNRSPREQSFQKTRKPILGLLMTMDWQDALQEAIHEPDPQIMEAKIRAAEMAIFARMQDFSSRPDSLEEQALFDALGAVKILRSARRLSK